MAEDIAAELDAIKILQETLEPLKPEVQSRVVDYVFRILGISTLHNPASPSPPGVSSPPELAPQAPTASRRHPSGGSTDILTLKELKAPTTGTQMVTLVAYYLAHMAPDSERQDFVTADEIRKYFIQGQFRLPGSSPQALVHAKNAGYLDAIEKGKYRLNSVGYNLVAHKMPPDGASTAPRRARKKTAKKTAKKAGSKR